MKDARTALLAAIIVISCFAPSGLTADRGGNKSRTAVVNWGNGKAYFFRGNEYVRWDIQGDRTDPGYPKPLYPTWTGLPWTDGVDAVVNWGNGKAYFFHGNEYVRWDIKSDRADPGYPKPFNGSTWPGLWK